MERDAPDNDKHHDSMYDDDDDDDDGHGLDENSKGLATDCVHATKEESLEHS